MSVVPRYVCISLWGPKPVCHRRIQLQRFVESQSPGRPPKASAAVDRKASAHWVADRKSLFNPKGSYVLYNRMSGLAVNSDSGKYSPEQYLGPFGMELSGVRAYKALRQHMSEIESLRRSCARPPLCIARNILGCS